MMNYIKRIFPDQNCFLYRENLNLPGVKVIHMKFAGWCNQNDNSVKDELMFRTTKY